MKMHRLLGMTLTLLSSGLYASEEAKTPEAKLATPPPAVTLSHPSTSIEFGFNALFLKPMASNMHYAAEADPLPAESPHWKIHDIHPDYQFGFDIDARGMMNHSNTNITLNWEHFHSSDSHTTNLDPSNMIGPFFEIGPDGAPYSKALGRASFHFNEVNLDFGLSVNFGKRLWTNIFTGVGYTYIKETMTGVYSNVSGTIARTITTPSSFWGVGPQLGIEFCYKMIAGLALQGRTRASYLVGHAKNHTDYVSISPGLNPALSPNHQSTTEKNRTQVVPALEMDLGLSYLWDFCKHYSVELSAGYQVQTYFNAIQTVQIGSEVNTPPVTPDTVGVFARTFEQTISNFSLAGPYVKLTIGF